MIRTLFPLTLATVTFMAGIVYAQEGTDTQAEPTTPSVGDLDLGEAGPRVGEQYVKEESGDWTIACIKTENGNDPCAMRQLLNGDQGQPIAEITLEKLPEGSAAVAGATVIVPLETLLQAQLALSIDGAPGKRYNYHHCNPVGCVVQMGFTQGDVDAMKAGTEATMSLVSILAPNQLVEMRLSLAGFTAGFNGISANRN